METINFKDVDFDTLQVNTISLGWDVKTGYNVTVWMKSLDSKDNEPFFHSVLPASLSDAIKRYLTNGINEVL